jgi:cytochrome P450
MASGQGIAGGFLAFRRDPLGTITRAAQTHGDLVQFRFGPLRAYVPVRPEYVQHILVDHHRNYSKRTRGYDALRLLLGNGLVTSEGEFWKRQRRIAQPAFHRQRIAGFADSMAELTQERADLWRAHAASGKPLDIAREMTDLTLRIVSRTLLSAPIDDANASIGEAVDRMNAYARDMMTNPLSVPHWVPTRRNRDFRRLSGQLDTLVRGVIESRRQTGDDPGDLLSMLMEARDDDGSGMTDDQLRDEVMTIFLAGHETTANSMSWTLLLLSEHPDVRRRLQAELDEVLGGRLPTFEDLSSLPYTNCVVQEAMRLYPPAWSIGRRAEEDDVIDGYVIHKNALMILSPWVTHRSPALWDNPEGFDPDRFGPDAAKRHRYAYFPFGGGPRQCIGNGFAMMEAQIILATLMSQFDVELVSGARPKPDAFITLQPRGGLSMFVRPVRPRSGSARA